ncbi:MAG: BspA family leucine-rich repeat surface protein [Prevotella sp.]
MQKVRILKVLAVMGIMLLLLPTNLMAERIPVAILRTNADGKTKTLTFTYAERPKVFARRGQNGIHRLNKGMFKDEAEHYKNFYITEDQPTWLDMKSVCDLNYANNDKITTVKFDKSFSMARPTSTFYWFWGLRKLKTIIGIENLNTSEVKYMNSMFSECCSLTELDVSGFNTANVENMGGMFEGCSQLKTIDVSGFNTANVEGMYGMFEGCSQLETLDISGFNTANVDDMAGMFSGCSQLETIDVSGFNTANVRHMDRMFEGCSQLKTIDVSGFNTANVPTMYCMFRGCHNLKSIDISSFNIGKLVSKVYGINDIWNEEEKRELLHQWVDDIFSGCSNLRTLNIGGNDFSIFTTYNADIPGDVFKGVGTIDSPCRLIVNQQFDQSVLGPKHDNGNGGFYRWLNGYFTLDTARPESETNY